MAANSGGKRRRNPENEICPFSSPSWKTSWSRQVNRNGVRNGASPALSQVGEQADLIRYARLGLGMVPFSQGPFSSSSWKTRWCRQVCKGGVSGMMGYLPFFKRNSERQAGLVRYTGTGWGMLGDLFPQAQVQVCYLQNWMFPRNAILSDGAEITLRCMYSEKYIVIYSKYWFIIRHHFFPHHYILG